MVKGKFAKMVLDKIPVLWWVGKDSEEGGIVIKEALDKNFYNAKIVAFIDRNPYGYRPCCLYIPLNEDKIIFYIGDAEYDVNPENTLFFSKENRKSETLKVDLAVYQYFYWEKGERINDFELLNTSGINLYNLLDVSFYDLYEKLEKLHYVYNEPPSGTILRGILGIVFGTVGIVPIALINKKYVLFRKLGHWEIITSNYHGDIIKRPEIEKDRMIEELYWVIDDKDLKGYYIATKEAYILSALRFVTSVKKFKVTLHDTEKKEAIVKVGCFGDVLLISKDKQTFIIITKTARDTAKILDDIVKSKEITIKDYSMTLTNNNCYYLHEYEII